MTFHEADFRTLLLSDTENAEVIFNQDPLTYEGAYFRKFEADQFDNPNGFILYQGHLHTLKYAAVQGFEGEEGRIGLHRENRKPQPNVTEIYYPLTGNFSVILGRDLNYTIGQESTQLQLLRCDSDPEFQYEESFRLHKLVATEKAPLLEVQYNGQLVRIPPCAIIQPGQIHGTMAVTLEKDTPARFFAIKLEEVVED